MDFLIELLLELYKKVRSEPFEHLDSLTVLVLEVTQECTLLLIFLLVLIWACLEIGQERGELTLALVELDAQLLLELILLLFFLRLI